MAPPLVCDSEFKKDSVDMIVSILFFLLFIPGLILNGVAAWVSLRLRCKTTFVVYLKNLVAADLLMTLTLPLEATSGLPSAPVILEVVSCKYSAVIFYFSMYMSVMLLGFISLDRFFKVVRPNGRFLCQNPLFGKAVSASIWMIYLCLVVVPTIILTDQEHKGVRKDYCMKMKSEAGLRLHKGVVLGSMILFWVVCAVTCFCYTCIAWRVWRSYRTSGSNSSKVCQKTKARVFVILAVFLLCYAPYHAIRVPYTQVQVRMENCKMSTLYKAKKLTLWLSATNVCLDPLIYFFLCRAFRKKLYKMCSLGSQSTP
ncbi:P2Y purinoceptor 14-like [Lampris incognitus]|uniref:P2Y purinoceptor 14-like n=1 Tax=Lampris incognitus TaxID=2546036 RepID=UPI0024B4FA39|nr:P2Y purinoceptor 14-like [Lampris incognitus]